MKRLNNITLAELLIWQRSLEFPKSIEEEAILKGLSEEIKQREEDWKAAQVSHEPVRRRSYY